MQVTHIRLFRRILVSLMAVVLVAVVLNYIQTARRRGQMVKPAENVLSPDLSRTASDIDYYFNENGGSKFHIHAQTLVETRQGRASLKGIQAEDLNPDGSVRNRYSGKTGEYDLDGKAVSLSGDVRLHLGKDVELRLETLHYDLKTQTGNSDGRVELNSPQAQGSARGVRYDNARRQVELMQDLAFILHRAESSGPASQGDEYRLSAGHGFYSEAKRIIRLDGGAKAASGTGTLSGGRIEAHLSEDGRRLSALVCEGDSVYESSAEPDVRILRGERISFSIPAGSRTPESIEVFEKAGFVQKSAFGGQSLEADAIQMLLNASDGLPRTIRSQKGVRFEIARGKQITRGTGEWLEAEFTPSGGGLQSVHVREQAALQMGSGAAAQDELRAEDIRMLFRELEGRSVPLRLLAEGAVELKSGGREGTTRPGRAVTAARLEIVYSEAGDAFSAGNATGRVAVTLVPSGPGQATFSRSLHCDRIDFDFFPGGNTLRSLTGNGNVRLAYLNAAQDGTKAPAQESTASSSSLRARFREADGAVATITQSGDFVYQDGTRTARAGTCDYDALTDTLVLRERPSLTGPVFDASGEVIEFARREKLLSIRRQVRSVLKQTGPKAQGLLTSSSGAASPTIVYADEMQYWQDPERIRYAGRVNLQSAESQLQADSMEISDSFEKIQARNRVRHFTLGLSTSVGMRPKGAGGSTVKAGDPPKTKEPALIQCERLQYEGAANRLLYSGQVALDSREAKLRADTMEVLLDPGAMSVKRVVARGHLKVTLPTREIVGEEADYLLAEGKTVITGNPLEVDDRELGKSRARRLTYFAADGRIVLENR